MLNIVWPIFIIISFLYAIFSGNLENLNTSIFNSTDDAVKLTINLFSNILDLFISAILTLVFTNFIVAKVFDEKSEGTERPRDRDAELPAL